MSDDFPTLRIRASGPHTTDITELRLGDIDLTQPPYLVNDIKIHLHAYDFAKVTLTMEVRPDVELPASVTVVDEQAAQSA